MLCLYHIVFFFLMIRPPPRSTRTDTLFPYTTLFRSASASVCSSASPCLGGPQRGFPQSWERTVMFSAACHRLGAGPAEECPSTRTSKSPVVHQIGRASCRESVCQYV